MTAQEQHARNALLRIAADLKGTPRHNHVMREQLLNRIAREIEGALT
jgi:hypothetical protein